MGAKGGKSIARTPESVSDALDDLLAGEDSPGAASSEKKTIARHQRGAVNVNQPLRKQRELDGDGHEKPLTMQEYIDEQARIRFSENAAIRAAMAMAFDNVGKFPTKEEVEHKQAIRMTQELWDEALHRISAGMTLIDVTQLPDMPAYSSFYRWMNAHSEASKQYQAAVFARIDKQVESITELSAELKRLSAVGASREEIDATKVLINSIQWTAARINPGKYGDKVAVDVKDERVSEEQINAKLAALMTKVRNRNGSGDTASESGSDEADA